MLIVELRDPPDYQPVYVVLSGRDVGQQAMDAVCAPLLVSGLAWMIFTVVVIGRPWIYRSDYFDGAPMLLALIVAIAGTLWGVRRFDRGLDRRARQVRHLIGATLDPSTAAQVLRAARSS